MANDADKMVETDAANFNAISRDDVLKFAIEEYKALRCEIAERSKMDHAIQRNAMLVTGAISSWVFSRPPQLMLAFVLLIIPLVLLIAHFQQARHKAYGMRIGAYIKRLECWIYKEFNESRQAQEALGWELFLEIQRNQEKDKHASEGQVAYWTEVKDSLAGKGFSLSATVVDARYLTIGSVLFFIIAVGYFCWVIF